MADRTHGDYEPGRGGDDGGAGRTQSEANSQQAAERDALLEERRARQMGGGSKPKNGRLVMGGLLFGLAGLAFVIVVGPKETMKIIGLIQRDDAQKTSQVDLEVAKQRKDNMSMDFLLPSAPPEKPPTDPNAEWNKRFEELQKKLDDVAQANKKPEVSLRDMQDLLRKYNDQMADVLDQERKKMSAENERLRAEAQRLEEEKRRAEELAKQDEARRKKNQDLADLQRQSKGVLVDESGSPGTAGGYSSNPDDLNRNQRFLASAAGSGFETSMSSKLADPSKTVVQGTIISAVLETAINTELPGNLRAQVTEPVLSFDGKRVLMPAGTTLIGTFNNDVEIAQKRVLIAWNRAVTPDGKSIALGSTGTDVLGRAGTEGNVDNRWKTKFGAGILISSISAIPTAIGALAGGGRSNSGTTINIGTGGSGGSSGDTNVGEQVASKMASQVTQQSQSVLGKYLSLPPVIRVPQGQEIRVFVNRDLIFR